MAGMSKSASKGTVVIVEGNPEGNGRAGSDLYKFYDKLQKHVESEGYDVKRDLGLSKTMPPSADFWIGHSRGNDRLDYAPDSQEVIRMGTHHKGAVNDKWDNFAEKLRRKHIKKNKIHWPDVSFSDREKLSREHLGKAKDKYGRWPRGEKPHMMLTDDMKKQLSVMLNKTT